MAIVPRGATTSRTWLLWLRGAHAAVFLAIAFCLFYVLFSAMTGERSALTWLAVATVTLEGAVLVVTKDHCPLSLLAERLGDDSGPVTRFFFPKWFLPWVTPTFVLLAAFGVAVVVLRG